MGKLEVLVPFMELFRSAVRVHDRIQQKDLTREKGSGGMPGMFDTLTAECVKLKQELMSNHSEAGLLLDLHFVTDSVEFATVKEKLKSQAQVADGLAAWAVSTRVEFATYLGKVKDVVKEIQKDHKIESVKCVRTLYRSALGESLFSQVSSIKVGI